MTDGLFKKSKTEFNVVSVNEITEGETFKCHGHNYEVKSIIEQRKERTKPEAILPKRFWASVTAKEIL